MNILVTGGAGYIGSITVRRLLEKGYNVVIIDNLSRGNKFSIPDVPFIQCDVADEKVGEVIKQYNIQAVIHFAAYAYVGESVENPGLYFENNLKKSLILLETLRKNNVNKIIFSSTCSTYGDPEIVPITESEKQAPINPYGLTKLLIEKALQVYNKNYGLKFIALRYFNAAGASYDVGEHHRPETHLIPLVLDVAFGRRDKIKIFGNDYPTPDGTCIRDYIHVLDIADAHILALEKLDSISGFYNIGTGKGNSVKEIIEACRKITGHEIPVEIVERRPGDPHVLVADYKKIQQDLGWVPKQDINDIIRDAWHWHNELEKKHLTVVTSGYFDPIHAGHIECIHLAKQLGGKLIVLLNNDQQCALKKGKAFMPLGERKIILEALRDVDEVFISIDEDASVCKSLEALKPDIFAKGGDRLISEIPETPICRRLGIQIIDGLGAKIQSSSDLTGLKQII
ncbi:UDP-glucose 4-epimerase GalE [Candidatus Woesearchaeota archaeon]|nr:UDP-glucose 4-epimerase GalE [Candidatus Woesearchaeota archaeon]